MIKSMTAFGSAETMTQGLTVMVEIRSFNSRFLDLVLRTPHGLVPFEDRIRAMVAERTTRGRVEVMLKLQNLASDKIAFEIDAPKARAFHDAFLQLKEILNLPEAGFSLDLLVEQSGCIIPVEKEIDYEAGWPVVQECLAAALADHEAMRQREGENIAHDFDARLGFLAETIEAIETESAGLLTIYQQRLKERISALCQDGFDPDPQRLAQEAAFLAERSDISEEIVRIQSHIAQFRSLMASDIPAGRKLNFLVQELNREFNTVGSKTESAGVAHRVVEAKAEIEKIREQVQNIE